MTVFVLLFLDFLFLIYLSSVNGIPNGQRMSIQKVPFIAAFEGKWKTVDKRYCGIILDEKLVVTNLNVPRLMNATNNIWVRVGVGVIQHTPLELYPIRRLRHNKYLAVVEVVGRFVFSDKVQRAILPVPSTEPLVTGRNLLAAGYGSLNHDDFFANASGLYSHQYYVDYGDDKPNLFILMVPHNPSKLAYSDQGGPVWDPSTGEVLGLVQWPTKKDKIMVHRVISLQTQRGYIDEARLIMHID